MSNHIPPVGILSLGRANLGHPSLTLVFSRWDASLLGELTIGRKQEKSKKKRPDPFYSHYCQMRTSYGA